MTVITIIAGRKICQLHTGKNYLQNLTLTPLKELICQFMPYSTKRLIVYKLV